MEWESTRQYRIGNNNIGSGNNVHNGDNLGVVNRPNYGGNTTINNIGGGNRWGSGWGAGAGGWGGNRTNINTNIVNNNINTNISHGGWGGGGYGRVGWRLPWRLLGRGGAGGWARPYYGNWYRGGWNNSSSFWTGFGVGALTGFGASCSCLVESVWGWGYPGMGMYSLLPNLGYEHLFRMGSGLGGE